MRNTLHVYLFTASVLLAACAPTLHISPSIPFEPTSAPLAVEQPDRYWWQLRFRITWPEDEQPDFSRHLLIAEQILLPVINEHQSQLPLWRFHRRAGRDRTGHQFSFIFFTDKATAATINEQITSADLTQWLMDRKLIERLRFNQRSPDELGRLELTSDSEWPVAIQRSWPWFIMGVSQAWLMLVQEISTENTLRGELDYPALLQHYQEVDAKLNAQWQSNGQHAYLHHLSALFGYQPVLIRSKELKTF